MSHGSVETMRVLVVDDNPDLVEVIKEFLERDHENITALTATNAEEATERLQAESVDCVVSDYDMPGTNGLELLREVRETCPEMPFILFTGKGSEEIASEAISAGVTNYLQKGTSPEQYTVLANRIERAVSEKRARTRQAEIERRLATLVENLPGIAYRCCNQSGWPMEYVSDGCEELTGYTGDELERGEVSWGEDIIHPEDNEDTWQTVQAAVERGEPFETTYRIRRRDGDVRWVWERGRAIEDDGDAVALEGFITDITPRKQREQELATEREFTESVFDALEDMFFIIDPENGQLVRWNARVPEMAGYEDCELKTLTVDELIADDHVERVREATAEAVTEGTTTVEADVVTAAGDRIPHEFRGTVIHDDEDELVGIASIGRDISDRLSRERELQRYETVVEAVEDPVYALDDEGNITFVNDAIERMTGHDPDELIGKYIDELLTPDHIQTGRRHIRKLLDDTDSRAAKFEVDVQTVDGETVPSELHIALLPTADSQFRGTAGIIRDITERKEREERLEQFASVVSHDLRNPLNVIQCRVAVAQETGDVAELAEVESAAARMEELIEDLLSLAQQGQTVGDLETVTLCTVVDKAWQSVDAPSATLDSWETLDVEADPDRLQELLENLFRNAVEHGGEDVRITVGRLDERRGFYVEDDGPDIPEDERADVFDHGYTTNEDGTGFGLAIVERIAEAHGWTVDVTDGADGGARFEFQSR